MTDCKKLSKKALEIHEKIKEHYPPDPWNKPQWIIDGMVYDNGWKDLRKHDVRDKLIRWYSYMIGSTIVTMANADMQKNQKFDESCFRFELHKKWIELTILLHELDFQIETLDLIQD